MTGPLSDLLRRRIRLAGPITLADFMSEALGHPQYGYYLTRDPFGPRGDFVTAPEASQMFGELIGLWCVDVWRNTGAPNPVRLVELGPGRGTLMADALRAARMAPDFLAAATVHLVETSPVLAGLQRRALSGSGARWHAAPDEVPEGPILLVANEFFDALPIRQFERTVKGWRERVVGLSEDGESFGIGLAPGSTPAESMIPAPVRENAKLGDVAEICPAGLATAHYLGQRISESGCAALIVDYGHTASAAGETLQAVRGHQYCDPLQDPGETDLTAHVDFAALAAEARKAGALVHGPIAQRDLLIRLGIETRAAQLLANATPAQAESISAGCQRLIGESEMGYLFKAMAITRPDRPAPAAFEESPI